LGKLGIYRNIRAFLIHIYIYYIRVDVATAAGLSAVNGGHHYYYYYYYLLRARSDGDVDGDEEEDERRKSSGSGVDTVAVPGGRGRT